MTISIMKTIVAIVVGCTLAFSGPNKSAEFFIDLGAKTPGIDSAWSCPVDSGFVAGIVINGAKKLYDYQIYVIYDTAKLRYVSAIKGNSDAPNILESNGGTVSFKANRSINDSTHVLIAGWLSGDDTSQCIDGSGTLALITFKKRTADTSRLALADPIVDDCDETPDTACLLHGAKVFNGPISVIYTLKNNTIQEKITCFNGLVRMTAPSGARDCRASVVDVFGREIRKFTIQQLNLEADLSAVAEGMYFVTMASNNKVITRPIFLRK